MAHMNTTTKNFPRTLLEAFPNDRADYACALEHHDDGQRGLPLMAWLVLVMVGAVLAVAVVSA